MGNGNDLLQVLVERAFVYGASIGESVDLLHYVFSIVFGQRLSQHQISNDLASVHDGCHCFGHAHVALVNKKLLLFLAQIQTVAVALHTFFKQKSRAAHLGAKGGELFGITMDDVEAFVVQDDQKPRQIIKINRGISQLLKVVLQHEPDPCLS